MKWVTLVAVLVTALLGTAAHAAVKALVDTNEIALGESLELTLSRDGQVSSKPDLTPLDQDFDVVSTSRSSNVRITNSGYSAETQLRLTLSPKRSGQLTIPSLSWDADKSSPIRVTVGGNGAAQPGTAQAQSAGVFLKTTVDNLQPYVQGAVQLTVRLYASVRLYSGGLGLPTSNDVLVQQLGKDRNSETDINGRHYAVVERQYLLFPQHSGEIKLPGPVLDAQVEARSRRDLSNGAFSGLFADMMQTTKPLRVHGDEIVLNVRPRPSGTTASYWIPAKSLEITGEWRPDNLEIHAGEPVTLDVHLSAQGLTAAQLPDVASLLKLPAGLKAYPDQPKLDNSEQKNTVLGRRDQSIALISDQPGSFELPAVRIQWWDTVADQLREAMLPARTLKVLPAVGGAPGLTAPRNDVAPGSAPVPQSVGANSAAARFAPGAFPWHWVSLALAVLWFGTAFAWWSTRRRVATARVTQPASAVKPNESQARDRFVAACRVNDAATARRHLIEWGRAKWPDAPPAGLRALANRIGNANVEALLTDLDRACFGGGAWNGSTLAQVLNKLPATSNKAQKHEGLAELYS